MHPPEQHPLLNSLVLTLELRRPSNWWLKNANLRPALLISKTVPKKLAHFGLIFSIYIPSATGLFCMWEMTPNKAVLFTDLLSPCFQAVRCMFVTRFVLALLDHQRQQFFDMSYVTVDMWEEGRRRSSQRSWKTSYLASGAKGKLERGSRILDD